MIVTGAGGKLGRLLRAAWEEHPIADFRPIWTGRGIGVEVQWDNLSGDVPDLPGGAILLHLAGVVRGTEEQLRHNSAMVPHLLNACERIKARHLIYVSTAAVYSAGPRASCETDLPAPFSPYGKAKAEAERLVMAQDRVAVTVLRLGNVAGADALLGPRPPGQAIELDPVPGRDGGPVRSWIGARSLASVLAGLFAIKLPPILNVAAEPPLPMAALLNASGLPWHYGPPTDKVVPDATMNTQLLHSLLPAPPTSPKDLAAEASWARGVLA